MPIYKTGECNMWRAANYFEKLSEQRKWLKTEEEKKAHELKMEMVQRGLGMSSTSEEAWRNKK